MEMADGITINKCDGNNIEKAKLAKAQFQNALHLFPMPESGWTPKVTTCSAFENINIPEVWQMVLDYVSFTNKNGYFDYRRNQQGKYWMYETIDEYLKTSFYNNPTIEEALKIYEDKVNKDEMTSFAAANKLLDLYRSL